MKLKLYCVGADASVGAGLYKSWLEVIGSIGMKLTSGIILIVKTKMFERTFVISDPMAINKKDTGFRATMMMMKDFEVSDPPKNVVIANMNLNLADVEVISRTSNLADVKITICDELNQPFYTIEKYNVPYAGIITSDFEMRGKLKAVKTAFNILNQPGLKRN